MTDEIAVGLSAVIFAVTDDEPRVLTVEPQRRAGKPQSRAGYDATPLAALPSGPFQPARDRTLELGLREWVQDQTQRSLGYVEQLYTFADQGRDPREHEGGPRVLSVAYLSLVREQAGVAEERWENCYEFLPWEDWRSGQPACLKVLEQGLNDWSASSVPGELESRTERIEICFGLGDAGWDGYKVLERYELLYEASLLPEAWFDRGEVPPTALDGDLGRPMAFDHRRILATGLGRVRGKFRYRPVVFELVAEEFTLFQLQRVVEAMAGLRLHKQNFRRLVESSGMVEGTGHQTGTGGRPAELFRFRREVLRERRAPGVGALSLTTRL